MGSTGKDFDDVDDDFFVSKKPQNYIFAEKKAHDINERTNKILLNTRMLVEESEGVGRSAIENLASQRETLERVEDDLDNINAITRSTQRHLNNMRSFFGGIKSLFSSGNSTDATNPQVVPRSIGIPKSATVGNFSSSAGSSSGSEQNSEKNSISANFRQPTIPDRGKEPLDPFDSNLSEIGSGLSRLKEMAMKMGDEIGNQNDILDRITDKSERAGDNIRHQNRQMQQLVKKG